MEEEAGVAGLRDGDVEGVVEHEDVVAVEVAAEEPVAVVEDGLDDAALYGETAFLLYSLSFDDYLIETSGSVSCATKRTQNLVAFSDPFSTWDHYKIIVVLQVRVLRRQSG